MYFRAPGLLIRRDLLLIGDEFSDNFRILIRAYYGAIGGLSSSQETLGSAPRLLGGRCVGGQRHVSGCRLGGRPTQARAALPQPDDGTRRRRRRERDGRMAARWRSTKPGCARTCGSATARHTALARVRQDRGTSVGRLLAYAPIRSVLELKRVGRRRRGRRRRGLRRAPNALFWAIVRDPWAKLESAFLEIDGACSHCRLNAAAVAMVRRPLPAAAAARRRAPDGPEKSQVGLPALSTATRPIGLSGSSTTCSSRLSRLSTTRTARARSRARVLFV